MKKIFSVLTFVVIFIFGCFLFGGKISGETDYKAVEVNGKTMRAHVSGAGNKTIVMLSGWGVDSPIDDFYPLYNSLSKNYKVVVLEYFGYGGSDLTEDARANANVVEEIRIALDKLSVKPPYILMPHSMSGIYCLYYANNYPSEVSGIIGIDMSLPQKQLERFNEETFEKTKEANKAQKLNISVLNQWNAFYDNSKELENTKYPINLPVLAFLAIEQIDSVDNMIKSKEMKTPWVEINRAMITNPKIQKIKILSGRHELMYDQADTIAKLSKEFIENF